MQENFYDIIIIGAGAAGLMAARELSGRGKKVVVLEARNRTGGRIHTITDAAFEIPVETGAEFIHGKLKLTLSLLKEAGINYTKVEWEAWQKKNDQWQQEDVQLEHASGLNRKYKELKEDISVLEFINRHLPGKEQENTRKSIENYVAGYYAGDVGKASTFALFNEWNSADEEQYRIQGGYSRLTDYLAQAISQKGIKIFLSQPVTTITRKESIIELTTPDQIFYAGKVLVTVPMGILAAERLRFSPALPQVTAAAKALGYGPVIKIILQFEKAFWLDKSLTHQKDMSGAGFIFSEEKLPTWWTQVPERRAMLTGWAAGPHAEALKELTQNEILQQSLVSLSHLFNLDVIYLQQNLQGWHVADWQRDKWSCGAYSYDVVGGKKHKQLLTAGIDDIIFFAGEGLMDGPLIGTVEAGLVTGQEAARRIIGSFH